MVHIPASIRTKNPGAMWPGPVATKWGSRDFERLNDGTGQGNKIAIFATYVQGICAQLDLWRTRESYRNKPFDAAIAVWSGGNHVEEYIQHVLRRVSGMTRKTIMNDAFWRSTQGREFLEVQASHEAGIKYPAPAVDWAEAQRIYFSGMVPLQEEENILPLIRIGDSGEAVGVMQKLLSCAATQKYSARSETEYALRLFQVRNGLDPDGICGAMTWDKLKPD